ncbi:hypothetical protein B0H19DRAFT_1233304 [Mycena capillaripes]|nr:hypothetical protein B0H19DRAFT_1233304 [Mycena capillaripes]
MFATPSKHTVASSGGDQERAEGLLRDLAALKDIDTDSESYAWPKHIDFTAVSTPTCQRIRSLMDTTDTEVNGPETPEREKIARRLDFTITQRAYYRAQRIAIAQELDDSLREELQRVYTFLKAARLLEFPLSQIDMLSTIKSARVALDRVEELVRGNTDIDATDPDSDGDVDPDKTRVATEASNYY